MQKIKKIKDNLIWLEKVSYPFKINTDQILFIEENTIWKNSIY